MAEGCSTLDNPQAGLASAHEVELRQTIGKFACCGESVHGYCTNADMKKVCVLLGWWGSNSKMLSRYKEIYENRLWLTHIYIASSKVLFAGHRAHESAILREVLIPLEKLLNNSSADKKQKAQILFHSFSNNGCLMYQACIRIIQKRQPQRFSNLHVVGAVFDSCPGSLSFSPFVKAVIARKTSLLKKMFLFATSIMPLLFYLGRKKLHVVRMFKEFFLFAAMHRFGKEIPKLFLYSESDDLIDSRIIEKVGNRSKEEGEDVELHKFEDSEHVAHIRKYPAAYKTIIENFITKVELPSRLDDVDKVPVET